jgi:hypothetical protein
MKNVFLLLLLPFLIMSCSDSEEENFSLVGGWSRTMKLENGVNIIDDCQIRDDFYFGSDGIFNGVYYYKDNGVDCEINEFQTDTWELSGNTLTIGNGNIVRLNIINNNKFEAGEGTVIEVYERN